MTPGRTVSESRVTLAAVVEPTDANFLGKMFGGALLARIDLCAYATSSRFCGHVAVTASFDRVDFHEPIEVGELVTMEGTVTYVGRTSMEVTIEVFAENLIKNVRRHTNTARVTMVAIENGKPVPVPPLICETRDDKIRFLSGKLRKERRFRHRQEFEEMMAKLEAATDEALDQWLAAPNLDGMLA